MTPSAISCVASCSSEPLSTWGSAMHSDSVSFSCPGMPSVSPCPCQEGALWLMDSSAAPCEPPVCVAARSGGLKGLERVCAGFAGHSAPYQPGLHVRRRVPRGFGAHDPHLLGWQTPNPEQPAARPERAAPSPAMLLKRCLPSVWSDTRLPRSTAVFWLQGRAAFMPGN